MPKFIKKMSRDFTIINKKILCDGITKISNALNKLESLNYLRRER